MEEKEEWELESLNINRNWYGNKDHYYIGSVKFKNGVKLEVSLKLDHIAATKMINLVREELEQSAKDLSNLIMKSMPTAIKASTIEVDILPPAPPLENNSVNDDLPF